MDIVCEEIPGKRLENKGISTLSNVELLSLIIGNDNQCGMNVARQILNMVDCKLPKLRNIKEVELRKITGVGSVKAKALLAAMELGKRISEAKYDYEKLESATAIYNFMHPKLQWKEIEEFWILLLNYNFKLLKAVKIGSGGYTDTAADVRIMLKEALLNNATVMAVCHNHPSGNTNPSRVDDNLTKRISDACQTMRIHFLDHVIVTDCGYYSYRENGRI